MFYYIHTYFIGSSPRGLSESILHYKIINQVHDNKTLQYITVLQYYSITDITVVTITLDTDF